MAGSELRYVLYETVFDELLQAVCRGDSARETHIRNHIQGLPTLERIAAAAAVDDVARRVPKRARHLFAP